MSFKVIEKFFVDMKTDFDKIVNKKDKDINVRIKRAVSLTFRALGALSVAMSTIGFIGGMVAVATPLAAIVLIANTVLGLIIAHDVIVVGLNKRKIAEAKSQVGRGVCNTISGVGTLLKKTFRELSNDTPYVLKGTILFAPTYRLLNNIQKAFG